MYSAFADVKLLQFNSPSLAPTVTSSDICQNSKTTVIIAVLLSWPSAVRVLPT
jgi:hypothetical protein